MSLDFARVSGVTVALAAAVLVAGCGPTPGQSNLDSDGGEVDAAPDGPVEDVLADSGCPAPAKITPAMVPSGYLPAQRANLGYSIDGDTAKYHLVSGEHTVRYLFVNTEESSGAETTAFGVKTKDVIAGWLQAATDIQVAARQGKTAGTPDLDPYGRWLALIFVDGELLQTRLVREGYSAYYTAYGCAPAPVHDALLFAEAEARANRRGIWAPGHPTDYEKVLDDWIGSRTCRPNPYVAPYCK